MRAPRILPAESGADVWVTKTARLVGLCILSIRATPTVYDMLTPSHRPLGDFLLFFASNVNAYLQAGYQLSIKRQAGRK